MLAALGLGGGTLGLGGFVASNGTDTETDEDQPYYYRKLPLNERNGELTLESDKQTVRLGEEITFEVTHVGESDLISVGCNINWALQRLDGDEWKHAAWTEERFHQTCATALTPGDTLRETLEMSEQSLGRIVTLAAGLNPGTYRFILYSPTPPAWTTFELEG